MIEKRVGFPAPFGPMSAVMRPKSATRDARSSASNPPKRLDTCSTRSSGSTIEALRRCRNGGPAGQDAVAQIGENSGDPARRDRNDQNENAAVNHEIEAGRVPGCELG